MPSCTGPNGRSTLTSARRTARRTALATTTISSMVISSGFSWPQRFTPTESPTETISAPARSAIRASWKSQATTETILRPARFISVSAPTVTFSFSLIRPPLPLYP